MDLLVFHPRKRFSIPLDENDYSIWDLETATVIESAAFLTMGRATPFAGWEVYGSCLATVCGGKPVYRKQP